MSKATELLMLQDEAAVKNSFYRAPKVTPTINRMKDRIEVRTLDKSVFLFKIDEVVLNIIADYKYCPYWLIQQWYEDFNNFNCYTNILDWIATGLVWIQATAIGIFVRPTRFLLDLFQIESKYYVDVIINNQVNHTCSEMDITFDINMGNLKSQLWVNINTGEPMLPCYHPLNIEPVNDAGTIVIREGHFRTAKLDVLRQKHDDLAREIKSKKNFTSEFNDWSMFSFIYTETDANGNEKESIKTPDVIVPIPRDGGKPKSVAIELELTPKANVGKYVQILRGYQNNQIYGSLYYLCSVPRTENMIKEAYNQIGKNLGTCRLYIIPYAPPAMRLSNFTSRDVDIQSTLITNSSKEY